MVVRDGKLDVWEEYIAHRGKNGNLCYWVKMEEAKQALLKVERDKAELRGALENSVKEEYIRAHILRNWSREKIKPFALHLLGEKWQRIAAKALEDGLRNKSSLCG